MNQLSKSNQSNLPTYKLTKQLMRLAKSDLSNEENIILATIIDAVVKNLSLGHSCLNLDEFCESCEFRADLASVGGKKIKLSKVLTTLNKSNLVHFFNTIDSSAVDNMSIINSTINQHRQYNQQNQDDKHNQYGKSIMLPLVIFKTKSNTPTKFKSSTGSSTKHLLYITRYFYYEWQISQTIKQFNLFNQNQQNYSQNQQNPHNYSCQVNQTLHTQHDRQYRTFDMIIDKFIQSVSSALATGFPNSEQISAIRTAVLNKLSIITGGPGTGKTTTVVLILLLLFQIYSDTDSLDLLHSPDSLNNSLDSLNIYVCAPTGKATMRAREAVVCSVASMSKMLNLPESILQKLDNIQYGTIHKLLGYKANNIYFKYNAHNLLKVDILIVDESSMISLPLFYKLLSALNLQELKHLILLGDKNQLSAVEEGNVFAPLVDYYTNSNLYHVDLFSNDFSNNFVNMLKVSNRNQGDIDLLGKAILSGDFNSAQLLIQQEHNHDNNKNIFLRNLDLNRIVAELFSSTSFVNLCEYIEFIQYYGYHNQNMEHVVDKIFEHYTNSIILCITNSGLLGVDNINRQIENAVKYQLGINNSVWYIGRPIIILENDYHLGLYNGDIGICVIKDNVYTILFEDGRCIAPAILPNYKLAYAITIHKSQGSEYNNVAIILPSLRNNTQDNNSDNSNNNSLANNANAQTLLTKELLYTAVTRAKSRVMLYSNIEVVRTAILHDFKRQTGISYLLDVC